MCKLTLFLVGYFWRTMSKAGWMVRSRLRTEKSEEGVTTDLTGRALIPAYEWTAFRNGGTEGKNFKCISWSGRGGWKSEPGHWKCSLIFMLVFKWLLTLCIRRLPVCIAQCAKGKPACLSHVSLSHVTLPLHRLSKGLSGARGVPSAWALRGSPAVTSADALAYRDRPWSIWQWRCHRPGRTGH